MERPPGVIEASAVYTIAEIGARSNLGKTGIREARRKEKNPLRVIYLSKNAYVRGSDFFAYLEAHGQEEHHSQRGGE